MRTVLVVAAILVLMQIFQVDAKVASTKVGGPKASGDKGPPKSVAKNQDGDEDSEATEGVAEQAAPDDIYSGHL
ncbi:hypothetical protein HDE_04676 [Halotydeus destructor]|nr:hypothetical protein HDE_04676 [Halotydeus destructor]